jgi:hypothetical protein
MPNKAKSATMDRATPTIRKKKTDADKVELTRTTSKAMQQSPSWAAAGNVQDAVKT